MLLLEAQDNERAELLRSISKAAVMWAYPPGPGVQQAGHSDLRTAAIPPQSVW